MKFGLIYNTGVYGTDPDQLTAVARRAGEGGFESFYVPEHIALYPGAAVGSAVFPPSTPIADPLECRPGRGCPGVHALGLDRHDRLRCG